MYSTLILFHLLIIHGFCFKGREQCNPKVKVTLDLNFSDCCQRLETAAADEADGDGLVQWSRPQQHPVKSQNEILMMSVC